MSFPFYPQPSMLKGYLFHLSNGTIYINHQVWCLSSLCRESHLASCENKLEFDFGGYLWILQKCILSKYTDSVLPFTINFANSTTFLNDNSSFLNRHLSQDQFNRDRYWKLTIQLENSWNFIFMFLKSALQQL